MHGTCDLLGAAIRICPSSCKTTASAEIDQVGCVYSNMQPSFHLNLCGAARGLGSAVDRWIKIVDTRLCVYQTTVLDGGVPVADGGQPTTSAFLSTSYGGTGGVGISDLPPRLASPNVSSG